MSVKWVLGHRDVCVQWVFGRCRVDVGCMLSVCRMGAGCTYCAASISMGRRLYLFGSAAHGTMLHMTRLAHGCMHAKGPLIHAPQSLTYTPPLRGLSLAFGIWASLLTCGGLVLVWMMGDGREWSVGCGILVVDGEC